MSKSKNHKVISKKSLKTSVFFLGSLLIMAAVSLLGLSSTNAAPQTFTVTADTEYGPGSFRQAIIDANSNGNPNDQDIIEFDIPGGGTMSIYSQESLIITESVAIKGYTQPEAVANTASYPNPLNGQVRIEVIGYDMPTGADMFEIESDNVIIEGLSVFGAPNAQIFTGNFENISIKGCYLNTDYTGLDSVYGPDSTAIKLNGTDNLTIGGPNPEDRNVIESPQAIALGDWNLPIDDPNVPKNLVMQGNNIFIGADSITGLDVPYSSVTSSVVVHNVKGFKFGGDNPGEGNILENSFLTGLRLEEGTNDAIIAGNRIVGNGLVGNVPQIKLKDVYNVRVGGTNPSSANIISDALDGGLYIEDSQDIDIQGNHFGINEDPSIDLPNDNYGIEVRDSTRVMIGGDDPSEGNIIKNSAQHNIFVVNSNEIGIYNNQIKNSQFESGVNLQGANDVSILGNSIYNNGGLGIDFDFNATTFNDQGDGDGGTNDQLNYPELYTPVINGGNTDITYQLDVPAGDYKVEFFSNTIADGTGYGEGEELIGSQNVTSLGTGSQIFTTTISGNSFSNYSATVTEINPDSFYGYGATSEFGNEIGPYVPPVLQSDISLAKTLTDPENIAQGGVINYELTYTNNGPGELDLSQVSTPFNSYPFIYDFMPTDLVPADQSNPGPVPGTFVVNSGNSDLTCIWGGAGSAATFFGQTAHPDYSATVCWYTGTDQTLDNGQSLTLNFELQISIDSELAFNNFAFAQTPPNATDPDDSAMEYATANGDDLLDGLVHSVAPINNFAVAPLPQDISINAELTNPEAASSFIGASLNYSVTLTNNSSITGVNLADYFSFENNLFGGAYPADNLASPTTDNSDITCLDAGPGSIAYLGPGASGHPGHQIISCSYTGTKQVVGPGQSYTVNLQFTLESPSSLSMYLFSAYIPRDPDIPQLGADLFGAQDDVLDTIVSPNYARVLFSLPETDLSITKTLTNPQEIAIGARANYQISLTNNGPDNADLSSFGTVGGGLPVFYDLVPIDLINPAGYITDGPFPGSQIIDVGNPDLTCLYGPAPSAAGLGITTDQTVGIVACWFTGSDVTLEAGTSINAELNFEVAPDSDLIFTNYALAVPLAGDPEFSTYSNTVSSGDGFANLVGLEVPINNFVGSTFPVPAEPGGDGGNNGGGQNGESGSGSNNGLSSTGQSILILIGIGVLLVLTSAIVYKKGRKPRV